MNNIAALVKNKMPHIHVKIVGKTDEEKARLAEEITKAAINAGQANEVNISVSIEDVEKSDWVEKVCESKSRKKSASTYRTLRNRLIERLSMEAEFD